MSKPAETLSYDDLRAERDLLQVEREQFYLLIRLTQADAQRATDSLRSKLRARVGVGRVEVAESSQDLAAPALHVLIGLYQDAARYNPANADEVGRADVADVVAGWTHRELVRFLVGAVARLAAGEAS